MPSVPRSVHMHPSDAARSGITTTAGSLFVFSLGLIILVGLLGLGLERLHKLFVEGLVAPFVSLVVLFGRLDARLALALVNGRVRRLFLRRRRVHLGHLVLVLQRIPLAF